MSLNCTNGSLVAESDGKFRVFNTGDIAGLDKLWTIVLEVPDQAIADSAITLLRSCFPFVSRCMVAYDASLRTGSRATTASLCSGASTC